MSYYLKYRPQKTSELDILAVRTFYANLLTSGKFAHAYLFAGPRGTGKTSSARILAKVINCETNKMHIEQGKGLNEPCGICDTCKRIVAGSSLSVVEMDAASNRGIDDIRLLRERISLAPAETRFTVYIIDEVHMLTTEAFNALLKTLEEPPTHAVFALCTTELHKLPATVVSRCTLVAYPKATPQEIFDSLSKAVRGEGLVISDESLMTLSRSVDGSFRDGMKLLEQLAQKGAQITDSDVLEMTHQTQLYDAKPLIDSLLAFDVTQSMAILASLDQASADIGVYSKKLLEELRTLLRRAISDHAIQAKTLLHLLDQAMLTTAMIKTAVVPILPLEILVVQWCTNQQQSHEDQKPTKVVASTAPHQKQSASDKQQVPPVETKKNMARSKASQVQSSESRPSGNLSLAQIEQQWPALLAGVKPLNHSLEALLRSSRPLSVDDTTLTIEVFYKFHKDRLDEEKHKRAIEAVIEQVVGRSLRLIFVLGSETNKNQVRRLATHTQQTTASDLEKAAEEIFA